jgi:hypothetical protein
MSSPPNLVIIVLIIAACSLLGIPANKGVKEDLQNGLAFHF